MVYLILSTYLYFVEDLAEVLNEYYFGYQEEYRFSYLV